MTSDMEHVALLINEGLVNLLIQVRTTGPHHATPLRVPGWGSAAARARMAAAHVISLLSHPLRTVSAMDRGELVSEQGLIGATRGSGGVCAASGPDDGHAGGPSGARPRSAAGLPSLDVVAVCLGDLRAKLARTCGTEAVGAGGISDDVRTALAPLLGGPLFGGGGLGEASDDDLVWCAAQLQRAINALEGARCALAGELAQRRLHARRGEASIAETLAGITSIGEAAARRVERDAKTLGAAPQVAEAFSSGVINAEQAAAVAGADVPGDVRTELCQAARVQTADETADSVRAAEAAARQESDAQRHARQRAARQGWMRLDRRDGMWHLKAVFDPLTGDLISRRLAKLIQYHWHSDKHLPQARRRTVPQRTADALAHLVLGCPSGSGAAQRSDPEPAARSDAHAHKQIDSDGSCGEVLGVGRGGAGHETGIGPQATQMIVITTLENLRDAAWGRAAVTDAGTELSAAQLRMLACDTQVIPAVMGAASEILDIGRAKRTISPAIRRALIARDQKCVWPRCERPPLSCDGHHINHWAHGGTTSIDNLALLCHTHHLKLHELNLELIPPTVSSAPGEGWSVAPAPPQPTPPRRTPPQRTPIDDHTRKNC